MNRTLVFATVGALAMALLMAMLISAGGSKKAPAEEILVAKKDLAIGSKLDGNTTRWQKWPNASAIPGALMKNKVKEEDWKDQKIRRSLTEGEPVTEGALVREIKGSYLAAALEPGMRAVAIDVKAASGVAGFVAPGDRVDVILTYDVRVRSNNNENELQEYVVEKASETILENVRIMATDQDSAGNAGGERKAKVSKTVTLEVNKRGAEKLALSMNMGELHLALRQLGDNKKTEATDEGPVTDVGMGRALQQTVTIRNSLENPTSTIRVYGPGGVQQVPVVGGQK